MSGIDRIIADAEIPDDFEIGQGIDQVGADLGHAGNAFHVLYPVAPQKRGVATRHALNIELVRKPLHGIIIKIAKH
nr:hypothetical protein [Brucella canis]